MSQETQAWAKTQKTGDPITKAVLLELCNWAKPTGVVEFLSLARIADAMADQWGRMLLDRVRLAA